MRHDIFIINPTAGRRDQTDALKARIHAAAQAHGLDYEICVTTHKGHATRHVAIQAKRYAPDVCRFYACGGDGTLNEVVCGAAPYANAEVACYPCGTGNDFIKLFAGAERFLDLDALIEAETVPFDLMQVNDTYAINVCSAGIDARVADWVGRNNRKLPFTGKPVYDLSVVANFFGKLYRRYEVELDGERLDGDYTILVAASGRYYGGGYYAVPEAEPGDRLLDFLLIRRVSHLTILRLIGKYQKGRHNEFGDYQIYRRGHTLTLRSRTAEPFNCDGEILHTPEVRIALAPHKLPVAVPQGSAVLHNLMEKTREPAQTRIR